MNDEQYREFLDRRGVETPCEVCGGSGVRTYGSTSTWMGGVGGQTMTTDVCDSCWGSGDAHRQGVNLKSLYQKFSSMEAEHAAQMARSDALILDLVSQACGSEGKLDSMARSSYAEAILYLESRSLVVVESDYGRRVIARQATPEELKSERKRRERFTPVVTELRERIDKIVSEYHNRLVDMGALTAELNTRLSEVVYGLVKDGKIVVLEKPVFELTEDQFHSGRIHVHWTNPPDSLRRL